MSEVRNNVVNTPRVNSPNGQYTYSTDLSQFAGEWQNDPSRKKKQERGVKTERAAGYTISVGEQSIGDYIYNPPFTTVRKETKLSAPATTATAEQASPNNESNNESPAPATTATAEQASSNGESPAPAAPVVQQELPDDKASAQASGETSAQVTDAPQATEAPAEVVATPAPVMGEIKNDTEQKIDPFIPEEDDLPSHWSDRKKDIFDELFPKASADGGGDKTKNTPGVAYEAKHATPGSSSSREYGHYKPRHLRAEEERQSATLKDVLNKIKTLKSKGFNTISKKMGSILLAGAILFGSGAVARAMAEGKGVTAEDLNSITANAGQTTQGRGLTAEELNAITGESGAETEQQHNALTGYEALDSRIDGSFERDDNPGCCESHLPSLANSEEIFKLMGVDPATATPEQYGKALEYGTYSMKYLAAYFAIANNLEGFKGLTPVEAEKLIASKSDEEKQALQEAIKNLFRQSKFSIKEANGIYYNEGVTSEGVDRHSYFAENDLTNTPLLEVRTADTEGNTVITYFKADCINPVIFVVVYNPTSGFETQPIADLENLEYEEQTTTQEDTADTPEIPYTPDFPNTPEKPDIPDQTTTTTLTPKNKTAEWINAQKGPAEGRVTQQGLNQSVTPKTTLEQDQVNFEAIKERLKEDEAKAAEAERVAKEQAELQAKLQRASTYYEAVDDDARRQQADLDAAKAEDAVRRANRAKFEAEEDAARARADLATRQSEADTTADTTAQGSEEIGEYDTAGRMNLYEQFFNDEQ